MPEILTVAETGSTNDDLRELAREGIAEGTWLRAERQTAGRGRQGRGWESPAGNLYASTVVRLRADDPPPASLALVAGVALWDAIADHLPDRGRLKLKWPNDLMLDGAKLSGILLEREADTVIVGCGANLAHHPAGLDRPVTCLKEAGTAPAPEVVLERLAENFDLRLASWRKSGLRPLLDAWRERALDPGTPVSVHERDGMMVAGEFAGVTDEGAMRLRLADGETRVIHAGDVFLV